MNEHEFLQKLAGAARWDSPPQINVAERVMRGIATARPRALDPVVGYFAFAACLAAAVLVSFAIHSWLGMQDPLSDLVSDLSMVIS